MIVLGIDTSGYANAVGVADGERILADSIFPARADSLEKIISNIDSMLKEAQLRLEDVQGFGVGLGPGSWTGIRIGVTVAKVLAYSAGKPVCGVPTLEVLAYGARNNTGQICPIIYAGTKDTVYAALYRTENGVVSRVADYYVGDLQGLSKIVRESTVVIAAEAQSYCRLIGQAIGSADIDIQAVEGVPGGAAVALLAAARLERGENDDVLSLEPLYLKESTARAFLGRTQAKGRV